MGKKQKALLYCSAAATASHMLMQPTTATNLTRSRRIQEEHDEISEKFFFFVVVSKKDLPLCFFYSFVVRSFYGTVIQNRSSHLCCFIVNVSKSSLDRSYFDSFTFFFLLFTLGFIHILWFLETNRFFRD